MMNRSDLMKMPNLQPIIDFFDITRSILPVLHNIQ